MIFIEETNIIRKVNNYLQTLANELKHNSGHLEHISFTKLPIDNKTYPEILVGKITHISESNFKELKDDTLPFYKIFGNYPIQTNNFNSWFMIPVKDYTKPIENLGLEECLGNQYVYQKELKENVLLSIQKLFNEKNTLQKILFVESDHLYLDGIINMFFIGNHTSYVLHFMMG